MHARKTARDVLFPSREDDSFFAERRGDVTFPDGGLARAFAERLNRVEGRTPETEVRPAEVAAMALLHQILHAVIAKYRTKHPESFARLAKALEESLGSEARETVFDFLAMFPPPSVYRALRGEGDEMPIRWLERVGGEGEDEIVDEIVLLWITNQNPAYDPVRAVVSDQELGARYRSFVATARRVFADEPAFGPRGETLVELLLAPGTAHPTSIFAQLELIDRAWARPLGLDELPFWRRLAWARDLRAEDAKWFENRNAPPGPGEPKLETMQFGAKAAEDEVARFSPDLGWMPNVILIAKSVYVWLDQLGKKYDRPIHRLDQIPDEELDQLASRGMNGLWLIGLFERSHASRKVKQMRGDHDALASAYSLKGYDIAAELGGPAAYESLAARARARGLRLAADMVPNHVGIDADWVINHPDWFLQTRTPPFPSYRFGGTDLSEDPRVGVFLEEGYWNKTDAAVVFRRHDRLTGEDRFLYHGNDGTSMPWNDTAQLDYLRADVRHAVIETILHVARMFPIIRFDAAMTLAKKHVQRLWYPLPGSGGAIPSRADYAMTQEEFDQILPVEFWREVVDTVAERAPDTLLLAEAFWMMEGFFVRTLGMHRVYNSAFMNMLKREENDKYRATIRNVLDFDAEILKRFVNFMNNPDEETAAAQFGDDDKYFGVCVLMITMPGLPMFGHGQIEGLREKYGMEYRRARHDEAPKEEHVRRHEREIFPLLHKRHLFSGVERFALYDFIVDGGHVDEDVYAYSNGAGDEGALVVFNNKWKTTRGRVFASTHRGNVSQELGIDPSRGEWLVVRDLPHGREYLRSSAEVVSGGLEWELHPFKYHVLSGFRPVSSTREMPYDRLAAELAGRGVPDIEHAVRELYLRPVHAPLREACSKGHIDYLTSQLDETTDAAARAALVERLGHVVDGLDWMLSQRTGRDVAVDRHAGLRGAGDRFGALHAVLLAEGATSATTNVTGAVADATATNTARVEPANAVRPAPSSTLATAPGARIDEAAESFGGLDREIAPVSTSTIVDASVLHVDLLLALIQVEAVLDILEKAADASASAVAGDSEARNSQAVPSVAPATPDVAAGARRSDRPALEDDGSRDRSTPAAIPSASASPKTTPSGTATATASAAAVAAAAAAASPSAKPSASPAATGSVTSSGPTVTASASASASASSSARASAATSADAVHVDSVLEATAGGTTVTSLRWSARESLIAEWDLFTPVVEGLATISGDAEARRRASLVLLAATLPTGALAPAVRLALGTRRGQSFMNVHRAGGTLWLNKERFEELSRFLAEREAAAGRTLHEASALEAQALTELAEREGYRAERIASRLGPAPTTTPPPAPSPMPSTR